MARASPSASFIVAASRIVAQHGKRSQRTLSFLRSTTLDKIKNLRVEACAKPVASTAPSAVILQYGERDSALGPDLF